MQAESGLSGGLGASERGLFGFGYDDDYFLRLSIYFNANENIWFAALSEPVLSGVQHNSPIIESGCLSVKSPRAGTNHLIG